MDAPKMDLKMDMDKKPAMETPVEKPEGSIMTPPGIFVSLEPKLAFLPRTPALVSLGAGWTCDDTQCGDLGLVGSILAVENLEGPNLPNEKMASTKANSTQRPLAQKMGFGPLRNFRPDFGQNLVGTWPQMWNPTWWRDPGEASP